MTAPYYSNRLFTAFCAIAAVSFFANAAIAAAPPANDNFANAQLLTGNNAIALGTNVEATLENNEQHFNANNKTVWFRWIAPANLSMTFETLPNAGTLSDTVIGVFIGSTVTSLGQIGTWADDINRDHDRKSRITFIAAAGVTYYIQVCGFEAATGTFSMLYQINHAESGKQFDFNGAFGSGFSDYAVFRPSSGFWYVVPMADFSAGITRQWGVSSDELAPGDYDGDSSTDIAIWRPSDGTFYILGSLTGTFSIIPWGSNGDKPVQGDFDGDDRADQAVWRASTGTFYVLNSSSGSFTVQPWGMSGDSLACGDYDGDGKTDFGVRRPSGGLGTFYIRRSSDGTFIVNQFGLGSDLVFPGDFEGDGKNDIAVYRNGSNTFYVLRSSDNGFTATQWGAPGDIPVAGNYAGLKNNSDLCVWRPSDGTFYCFADGGTGSFAVRQWGINGDRPIGSSNVH